MLTCVPATGLDRHKRSWGESLAMLMNPFSWPLWRAGDRSDGGKLPPVSLKAIPRSWDPVAERRRIEAAQRGADEMEETESSSGAEEEVEDEMENVDVLMTGMGK